MTETPQEKICPRCQTSNPLPELQGREYRCARCGLELAHLDIAANGAIRGLFGWLLALGDVVGERYRIAAVLGKGGFGVTYLVEDLRLQGKRRALKEIPELLFDEHETKLLGRLNHPAVPDIIDRLTDRGMVYLVLEFGGSRTLRSEQERHGGRIPVSNLLPWVEQICTALTYLHSQDPPVVHRDLKPENVLLDDNDRVMLIDFGIAKESSPDTVTRTLGRAVTHGFSPPEQVLGTGTDARSDVYALGAILYSMLTGHTPTPAHERVTGKGLDPVSHYLPDIDPLLDAAIAQALELNINARQQSVGELARELGLVRAGSGSARTLLVTDTTKGRGGQPSTAAEVRLHSVQIPSSRSPATPSSQTDIHSGEVAPRPVKGVSAKGAGIAAVLALAVLGGGGAWLLMKKDEGPQPGEAEVQPPVASVSRDERAPEIAPPVAQDAAAKAHPDTSPAGAPSVSPGDPLTPATAPPAATAASASEGPAPPPPTERVQGQGGAPAMAVPEVPRRSAADLPSVFSDEQAAEVRTERDSGSLMDLFESHRSGKGQEAPPVAEPAVTDAPAAAPGETGRKRVVATPPVPKPKPRPAPPKKPDTTKDATSGSPSWTINYKGARKTD